MTPTPRTDAPTPLTDAEIFNAYDEEGDALPAVDPDFARQLERALIETRREREEAIRKAAQSGNYVADKEVEPTVVWFSNGRVVRAVGGYLTVEMTDADS